MLAKAEVDAERESDKPVGGEVAEHGSARVSCAAERAGGHGLNAVEELKSGTYGEQSNGAFDDDGVVGVHERDIARKDEQDDAHAEHEAATDQDGGIA